MAGLSHGDIPRSSSDLLQNAEDQEWEAFHSQLHDIPHSFLMEDQQLVSNNSRRRFKDVLEADLRYGFKTGLETARTRNLLAYILSTMQGMLPKALLQTEESLKIDGEQNNLVSLGNQAVILWQMGRQGEARELVSHVQGLKRDLPDFDYLLVKAQGELAFSYNRMGPALYHHAQRLFLQVIPRAREPEVYLWKFGLAMTKRRYLNFQRAPVLSGERDNSKLKENLQEIVELFLDVTDKSECRSLKAKAFVEIAFLLDMKWQDELRTLLSTMVRMSASEACSTALELDDNDCSVLWKSGRLLMGWGGDNLEKARDLLERATSLRPSTAEYHNLALVYKKLAEKSRRPAECPDTSQPSVERLARGSEVAVDSTAGREGVDSTAGREGVDSTAGREGVDSTAGREGGDVNRTSEQLASHLSHSLHLPRQQQPPSTPAATVAQAETSHRKLLVKDSPQLSLSDAYLQKAVQCLQKAVELSQEENMHALQDLALVYKDLGQFDLALDLLEKIIQGRQVFMGPLDKVSAYKDAGLILKKLSEREEDEGRKRELEKRGESMLNMALLTASRLCAQLPHIPRQVPDIWHSFTTLLKAADESDRKPHEKVREKARLFQLIKDHKQSIKLLQTLEEIAPEERGNPEHLKMLIQNLVALQQYEEALAFMEIIRQTSESSAILSLFGDKHYVQKVYMQAAKQALLELSNPTQWSRPFFKSAFTDLQHVHNNDDSSSEGSTSGDDSDNKQDMWDIILLHDDAVNDKADTLAELLHDVCGLKVTSMDTHVLPGKLRVEGVMRMIRKSHLVVVLASDERPSRELRCYLNYAAQKANTVTLLLGGNHVPKMLRETHRSMTCPVDLMTHSQRPHDDKRSNYSETFVTAICELFGFLVGVSRWAVPIH